MTDTLEDCFHYHFSNLECFCLPRKTHELTKKLITQDFIQTIRR